MKKQEIREESGKIGKSIMMLCVVAALIVLALAWFLFLKDALMGSLAVNAVDIDSSLPFLYENTPDMEQYAGESYTDYLDVSWRRCPKGNLIIEDMVPNQINHYRMDLVKNDRDRIITIQFEQAGDEQYFVSADGSHTAALSDYLKLRDLNETVLVQGAAADVRLGSALIVGENKKIDDYYLKDLTADQKMILLEQMEIPKKSSDGKDPEYITVLFDIWLDPMAGNEYMGLKWSAKEIKNVETQIQ